MKLAYPFATDQKLELTQVGGKGMSLILMTRQGLPVPPGFVLPVAFFKPWFDYIQSTPEWTNFLNSAPEELKKNCTALQTLCLDLELDDTHHQFLNQALVTLKMDDQTCLFAVRSSSPEEDLEGASFAGGYETVLGVQEADIEEALRRSFASCLDERVIVYKKEHGFAVDTPRIAVIVQKQVDAQTAGVAFSLNPINNCYDQAVINANFGVGESVVSGIVSPDSFIVNKVSRTILERKIGQKQTAIWLAKDGGTYAKPPSSGTKLCLSDEQVLALTDMLIDVENYYKKPIDIEWVFADGTLYLLQARPITTYIPLPQEMLTAPGEPKLLYLDATLSKQGIHDALSVMGTEFLREVQRTMFKDMAGKNNLMEVKDGISCTLEGRAYINVSNLLKIKNNKRFMNASDPLAADIIENINDNEYVPRKTPPNLKGVSLKLLLNNLKPLFRSLKALKKPVEYKKWFLEESAKYLTELKEIEGKKLSFKEYANELHNWSMKYFNISLPLTIASELARSGIKKSFKKESTEIQNKVVYLERSLPDNITIEMGLAMYRLAQDKAIKECPSKELFTEKLEKRSFSPEFQHAWDVFMQKYGFRCPKELDVATARTYENPAAFFEQLRIMALNIDPKNNPHVISDKARVERENSFEELLQIARQKGNRHAKKFTQKYKALVELGGYREIHKYYLIKITDMFRRRVLAAAQTLLNDGRIDNLKQVFDLTIDDLDQAMADSSVDLRAQAEKNTRFLKKIKHIREFPRIIDSRGQILHAPPKEAGAGEVIGEPIAPGIIRGKIKVLHSPDEKPILPGEILVARATDPGWTPLFINAGGIILEVGGMLQHGACVAREYGKPCVAGIENATSILKDGQMVELDGLNGIIRLVHKETSKAHSN